MTTAPEFTGFLAPTEEAREHPADGIGTAFEGLGEDQPADPEAPWGRKADGTPKAKPGRPAGTPDRSPRTRTTVRRTRMAAPQPKKQRASKPKPTAPDYRPGITGILQMLAAPLMVAGLKSPALGADAAAIVTHAEPLADALQETAEQVPAFAAVLERVLQVGPYGALVAAVMPLGLQIAVNHGLLREDVGQALGAQTPADLVASLQPDPAAA